MGIEFKSTSQLAVLIKAQELSPVELINTCIDRIAALQPTLNAFLDVWTDAAITNAKLAEEEIFHGKYRGPLHGIPIGFKDLVDVSGTRTTGGSKLLTENIAKRDATIVSRLRSAGAIPIGKLNLVEFAFGTTGLNPNTGNVKNPWDTSRVTAGSSSGSAAAVASGMIPLAIGTDTGGSIRMPSALCGIAGFKPTYGRIPRDGVLDLSWSMDHVGPMARTTEDCAFIMNAVADKDLIDPSSSSEKKPDFTSQIDSGIRGLKIGVPVDYFFDEFVDDEILKKVKAAINLFAENGAEIVELHMPWISKGREINLGVMVPEAVSVHAEMLARSPDLYTPEVRHRIQSGSNAPADDYIRAKQAREWFNQQVAQVIKDIDVLLTPTVPIQAPTIKECTLSSGNQVGGSELPIFTSIFNVTGQPSHNIPCGFTKDCMPVGMMITGHPFDDVTVLRTGYAYEQLTDWHQREPKDIVSLN